MEELQQASPSNCDKRAQTQTHWLSPMFSPGSVALVGASRKRHSVGNDMVRNLVPSGFEGPVYPVNPNYETLGGRTCFPSIGDLPTAVDLAILAIPNGVLENSVGEAISAGSKSIVIFGSAEDAIDASPSLKERVSDMTREANVALLGANCMGFFNPTHSLRAFSAFHPEPVESGGISYIAQSGSLLQALLFNDDRLKFNLAVSTGQELATTAADIMEYALEQDTTPAIALVIETIRDADRFVNALKAAADRDVPVIALKLGRSAAGAAFALSHTGAVAGDAAVFEAVLRHHGVASVRDLNELAATTLLLSNRKRPVAGGLSAVLDSGGERQLIVDVASDHGIRFADIGPRTIAKIENVLDPGLSAVNPVDAWGTGKDFETIFETCLTALLDDPDTAIGMLVADLGENLDLHDAYLEVCRTVAAQTDKLLVVMTNYSAWAHRKHAQRLDRSGIPVLDGTVASLRAIKHAIDYRDFQSKSRSVATGQLCEPRVQKWLAKIGAGRQPFTEDQGYELLSDYGIPTPNHRVVTGSREAVAAAEAIGYPVVLKTAIDGILHKTEVNGVITGINNADDLRSAYQSVASRLGPRAIICESVTTPVEMALGVRHDDQYGPLLMVGFGGTLIELLQDTQLTLVPVDTNSARRAIRHLRLAAALDGHRGRPACDVSKLVDTMLNLSNLARELGPWLAELDINPLFVGPAGATAADCLVVPAQPRANLNQPQPGRDEPDPDWSRQ